jgi:hypothetical protein
MKFKVSDLLIFAIRRYSHVHGYTDEFKVIGNTTVKVNNNSDDLVKYYATKYMNGEKRYDYAMFECSLDDGSTATCPAIILGLSDATSRWVFVHPTLQMKKSYC